MQQTQDDLNIISCQEDNGRKSKEYSKYIPSLKLR
jgi:hypothetical protein